MKGIRARLSSSTWLRLVAHGRTATREVKRVSRGPGQCSPQPSARAYASAGEWLGSGWTGADVSDSHHPFGFD